ncbi:FHA domain-containing protein PS1 [Ananas comosus]|uniref:FHA domain-containing protein PS1 n=1 Tax=Ananas comosus TaxID=4615 RepID=A0A199V6M2_ANACO|nr:FHA domain-containing protein PS1 [Ananas comosus]
MKWHESFFRRPSSKASSTLQWIEECMENTSWWLHVQSSLETKPATPTPPITPTFQFIDGNNELGAKIFSSMPFSRYGNFMDIVSPTVKDHILDCALLDNARFRISSQMPSSSTASSDVQFETFIISIISSLPISLSL